MRGKWLIVVLTFAILVAVSVAAATDVVSESKNLTVHEWGTFTSVAGSDGQAVEWLPVDRQSDLPCFVNQELAILEQYLSYTVRMETPVLYFYTSREMTVNATVRFPKGWITEWYPQAKPTNHWDGKAPSMLEWRDVKVRPNTGGSFPVESAPSHYYIARQTDAAPVRVKDQSEKFLFYRGVGDFPIPISAKVEKTGKIRLESNGASAVPGVILFERRGGKVGYRLVGALKSAASIDPPTLDGELASLQGELRRILVTAGLYPKEAAAMVATWSDSWFEEGTRLFYFVPPRSVDTNLPLNIDPKPAQVARVFVGRIEVITATTEKAVADALRTHNDSALRPHRRFLRPIMDRLAEKSANPEDKERLETLARVVFDDATLRRYELGSSECPRN